jgi:hypothetical protein
MDRSKKPTFYQLRLEHSVNMYELSQASGLSSLVVWSMLTGRAVTRDEAQHILDALNTLRGTHYELTDVEIALKENESNNFSI